MTEEQKQRKLEANRAYRLRKKQEAELSKHPTHYEGTPTPEAEEEWKRVQVGKPISAEDIVHYVDSREKAEAILADSTARAEYVELLFQKYAKTTNIPQLLAGLIREQIETRVVMIDLLAEILNEVRK